MIDGGGTQAVGLFVIGGGTHRRVGSGVGSGSLSNPSIGVGLTGIADWSSENPFLDVFKSARPWKLKKGGESTSPNAMSFQQDTTSFPLLFPCCRWCESPQNVLPLVYDGCGRAVGSTKDLPCLFCFVIVVTL